MAREQNNQNEREFTPSTNRIEAFSDGVYAIVVTLLVLELRVPQLAASFSNTDGLSALYEMLPKFVSFILSFVIIAIYWVNHHQMFHGLECADRPLLWYNNFLLFWMCFIPFPTAFLGEHPLQPIPVMLYGAVMMFAGISFNMEFRHCLKAGLFRKNISQAVLNQAAKRALLGPIVYFISAIAALVSVYISLAIFIIVPIMYFIPQKIVEE